MGKETDLIWATLESIRNNENKLIIDYLQAELLRITNKVQMEYDRIIKEVYNE